VSEIKSKVIIANPVLNSPFEEPKRHFIFEGEDITDKVSESRRPSGHFTPIARARSRDGQAPLEFSSSEEYEEIRLVNEIRRRVRLWRENGANDLTQVTRRLLEHWGNPDRSRRLFFCQREALEAIIYVCEVARKSGDNFIDNELRQAARDAAGNDRPNLFRLATKMATGSGKTVVMAMIIAWHTLNKAANPQDARFTNAFLLVAPGITIRDRLRVLHPSDPENYYDKLDLVPSDLRSQLNAAKISITNYHAFKPREKVKVAKLTKDLLAKDGKPSPALVETEGEMARRILRSLGTTKHIVVLNDEGHHCYRGKPQDSANNVGLTAEDKAEAKDRDEAARVWISGLEAISCLVNVKAVHDLSATPFYLSGSGYPEGSLFPWVISDFSLIDAIESGIVKVPRVPVDDNAKTGELPMFRDIWSMIRDQLPKKRVDASQQTIATLPKELEASLHFLYDNYAKRYEKWQAEVSAATNADTTATPPVFIVVCNNTAVSKLVFDWISGYQVSQATAEPANTKPTKAAGKAKAKKSAANPSEDSLSENPAIVKSGKLPLFDNTETDATGRRVMRHRPYTILVDSQQLESGDALSADFKAIARTEIDEFKQAYVARSPGADPEKISDEDVLREVLNTVGKPGKLGEHIRCVVSVSMLTEGWDANTVTHVLGVRGFRTRLLCEQVVGRALRRMTYRPRQVDIEVNGRPVHFEGFPVEYAEVYGIPFSFIPTNGSTPDGKPGPIVTRVRALEERADLEITFPRIERYSYDLPDAMLVASFDENSRMPITTRDMPSKVEVRPIVGEGSIHESDLKAMRRQTVAFSLAQRVYENMLRQPGSSQQAPPDPKPWLFPELVTIARRWLDECLMLKDNTYVGMLRLTELEHRAADKVFAAIVRAMKTTTKGDPIVRACPVEHDPVGSTRGVDFDTARPCWASPAKSHISHIVCDTESWEQKTAQALEDTPEVLCYTKNFNLHFSIPYTYNGQPKQYIPDFIVHLDDGRGPLDPLRIILELSGKKEGQDASGDIKAAKASATRNLWVPGVNELAIYGRWAFLEVFDPWDVENTIRGKFLAKPPKPRKSLSLS
jgi:type III restriction enzyme